MMKNFGLVECDDLKKLEGAKREVGWLFVVWI